LASARMWCTLREDVRASQNATPWRGQHARNSPGRDRTGNRRVVHEIVRRCACASNGVRDGPHLSVAREGTKNAASALAARRPCGGGRDGCRTPVAFVRYLHRVFLQAPDAAANGRRGGRRLWRLAPPPRSSENLAAAGLTPARLGAFEPVGQCGAGACGTVDCCHERESQTHPWEAPTGGT
jgi:hypothetical protein